MLITSSHDRHRYQRKAFGNHVENPGKGHQAGNDRPQASPCCGIPLPPAPQRPSRQAGSCAAKVPHRDFCSWLLLASSQWLLKCHDAKEPCRILGSKTVRECQAGQHGQNRIAGSRLAHPDCLGVCLSAKRTKEGAPTKHRGLPSQ